MPRRFYQQRGRGGTLFLLCVSTSPDLLPKDARRKSTFCFAQNRKKEHTHTKNMQVFLRHFFLAFFFHHFFHPKTGAKSQLRKVGNQSSNFPSSPSSRARSFTTACHEGVEVSQMTKNPSETRVIYEDLWEIHWKLPPFPHETPHLLGSRMVDGSW